jgi:hypothetical protein
MVFVKPGNVSFPLRKLELRKEPRFVGEVILFKRRE